MKIKGPVKCEKNSAPQTPRFSGSCVTVVSHPTLDTCQTSTTILNTLLMALRKSSSNNFNFA